MGGSVAVVALFEVVAPPGEQYSDIGGPRFTPWTVQLDCYMHLSFLPVVASAWLQPQPLRGNVNPCTCSVGAP